MRLGVLGLGGDNLTGASWAHRRIGGHAAVEQVADIDVRAAVRGDADAFGRLVRRHVGLLDAACRAAGVDGHDLDDAMQAAIVAIWRGLGGFRGEAALTTWMYTVARNAARRSLRRSGPPAHPVEKVPDRAEESSADAAVELRHLIREAMGELPSAQREALLLSAYTTLSTAEIAAALGVADGTVRSWISRARATLRRHLEEVEV